MELKKATRKKVKLKMGLNGPSGSGKTMGALKMAYGMTGNWEKVAVIDTENESASLYSHLGEFQSIDLAAPFSPERFIEAIETCEKAGIEICIIDSATHEWAGAGGCLELNEKLAQTKYRGNTWSAWNETTPRHDRFVNCMLQSNMHIIVCNRSKVETIMGDDKKVKKLGMKEIQRDGFEYDLSIVFTIDRDTHTAIASKDRSNLFESKDPFMIDEETGRKIREWCETGATNTEQLIKEAVARLANCNSVEDLTQLKEMLELNIVDSNAFKIAGAKRYKEISQPATAA